jgi:hypothetical protein
MCSKHLGRIGQLSDLVLANTLLLAVFVYVATFLVCASYIIRFFVENCVLHETFQVKTDTLASSQSRARRSFDVQVRCVVRLI